MKYLGIDYGLKRTGLAVSDEDGRIAVLKKTLYADAQQDVISAIKGIVDSDEIDHVVVGLPKNMDNESTEMTEQVERFVEKLRNHVNVPVQTVDERLTTEMANRLLRGVDKEKRDQVAAQILLQNYLDSIA